MPQSDKVSKTGARVSYLRGVLDGQKLSQDERLELVLSTFVDVTDKLLEVLAEVREEQAEIRRLLAGFGPSGPGEAQADPAPQLSCPQCGQRLAIGPELLEQGPVELTCPECHLTIEVV